METRIVSRQEMHPVKSHVGVLREEYVTLRRLRESLMTKAEFRLLEALSKPCHPHPTSFSPSEDSQTPQLALIVAIG
jgi:hypothetical protein